MLPLSEGIPARRFPIVNVAFFADVGGFIFGLLAARLLARAGQAAPGERWRSTA
jgi:membrane associated rhomboid family serine protease